MPRSRGKKTKKKKKNKTIPIASESSKKRPICTDQELTVSALKSKLAKTHNQKALLEAKSGAEIKYLGAGVFGCTYRADEGEDEDQEEEESGQGTTTVVQNYIFKVQSIVDTDYDDKDILDGRRGDLFRELCVHSLLSQQFPELVPKLYSAEISARIPQIISSKERSKCQIKAVHKNPVLIMIMEKVGIDSLENHIRKGVGNSFIGPFFWLLLATLRGAVVRLAFKHNDLNLNNIMVAQTQTVYPDAKTEIVPSEEGDDEDNGDLAEVAKIEFEFELEVTSSRPNVVSIYTNFVPKLIDFGYGYCGPALQLRRNANNNDGLAKSYYSPLVDSLFIPSILECPDLFVIGAGFLECANSGNTQIMENGIWTCLINMISPKLSAQLKKIERTSHIEQEILEKVLVTSLFQAVLGNEAFVPLEIWDKFKKSKSYTLTPLGKLLKTTDTLRDLTTAWIRSVLPEATELLLNENALKNIGFRGLSLVRMLCNWDMGGWKTQSAASEFDKVLQHPYFVYHPRIWF